MGGAFRFAHLSLARLHSLGDLFLHREALLLELLAQHRIRNALHETLCCSLRCPLKLGCFHRCQFGAVDHLVQLLQHNLERFLLSHEQGNTKRNDNKHTHTQKPKPKPKSAVVRKMVGGGR